MFLSLLDPDPLVGGTDPDQSISKQDQGAPPLGHQRRGAPGYCQGEGEATSQIADPYSC